MTNIALSYAVHRKTSKPLAANTSVDPTEAFKTVVKDIIEGNPFLVSPICYESETLLLHMDELKQERNYAADNYKAAVTHLSKYLLLAMRFFQNSSLPTQPNSQVRHPDCSKIL